MYQSKKGFTLIELLVVISIIAVLLSVLMPALSKAKYMTKRLICMTRVKDQATSLLTYASDWDGRFSPNNANGPQYMRSPALLGVYSFDAMINTYITNTEVMFCPIIESSHFGNSKRYYDGSFSGWDILDWSGVSSTGVNWDPSSMPLPAYISPFYCWFVNFRQDPGISAANKVVFAQGETPWPEDMEDCSSRSTIITHEVSADSASILKWDYSHGGLGWFGGGIPIAEAGTDDSPIGRGDGSVTFRKKNEMKPRGNAPWGGAEYWYVY